jgi:hypothetical protein
MKTPSLLLDENVPLAIQTQLAHLRPHLKVYAIGYTPTPVKGTPDPEILAWIEVRGCLLIINNITWRKAAMCLALSNFPNE